MNECMIGHQSGKFSLGKSKFNITEIKIKTQILMTWRRKRSNSQALQDLNYILLHTETYSSLNGLLFDPE